MTPVSTAAFPPTTALTARTTAATLDSRTSSSTYQTTLISLPSRPVPTTVDLTRTTAGPANHTRTMPAVYLHRPLRRAAQQQSPAQHFLQPRQQHPLMQQHHPSLQQHHHWRGGSVSSMGTAPVLGEWGDFPPRTVGDGLWRFLGSDWCSGGVSTTWLWEGPVCTS